MQWRRYHANAPLRCSSYYSCLREKSRGETEYILNSFSINKRHFQQTKGLLHGSCHVSYCSGRGHGGFQCGYLTQYGKKGIYSGLVACSGILSDGAGEGDDGLAVLFGKPGNTDGSFAHYSLAVKAPFTCNYNVSSFYWRIDADLFQNNVDSGLKLSF